MFSLEHRIPPPIVAALVAVGMWLVASVTGSIIVARLLRISLSAGLVVVGFMFILAGGFAFRRAKTTVSPLNPDAASSLVITGVYQMTRNPMYLGFAILLLAWSVYLAAPVSLIGPVLFVAYITRFQIIPEERMLAQKFPSEFTAYRQKVRRWL